MKTVNTRILVIDDDPDIWKAYQLVLAPDVEDSGENLRQLRELLAVPGEKTSTNGHEFQLSFAKQGKEGCEMASTALAQRKPFALAFVDIRMPPGWDGMETAARLHQIDPDLEIIIVTAYSDRSCDEIVRAVGSPHKLLFLRKPFDAEELKRLTVSLTDKWQMARDEEARHQELQTLLCTSPAAIFSFDVSLHILSWNQAAELFTGYTAADVIGGKCIFHQIADDPTCKSCVAGFCGFEKNPLAAREINVLGKEGYNKVLSLRIAHVPASKDRPAKNIGSFWDITALKETQEKLSTVNRQLKDEIAEKDRLREEQIQLERKLHQAQKMQALGLMAGGVAHDLNNILSGLVGYPELLLMQLPKNSELRESILAISESGKRAAEVVADLLTIARGATSIRETVSLNTLITEYLRSPEGRKTQSLYPDIAIRTHLDPGEMNISCSPVHVKKCLMNLLTNAAEAIATSGSIDITTTGKCIDEAEAATLDVNKGRYIALSVADTGPGIAPADLERIFEPFYTKKSMGFSGTGLGLTVVWNTIKDHEGAITINSSNTGTTFTLYFPETEAQLTKKPALTNIADLAGSGTILVVDDESQQRDVTGKMLSILGYTVTTLASGEEAVAYLQDHTVDLLLLDMIMPGINGRETYERIIQNHPGQRALFISGYSQDKEVERGLLLGIDGFVKKPFTLEELALAVKRELQAEKK
ncbi:MAG: response regulator [Desulfobulbaceae bacterium]